MLRPDAAVCLFSAAIRPEAASLREGRQGRNRCSGRRRDVAMLAYPVIPVSLRGTGEFVRSGPGGPRLQFVRHSCCLPYRVPGAGTCGDCVLTASRSR